MPSLSDPVTEGSADHALVAELRACCAGVSARDLLHALYWDRTALGQPWFKALADALAAFDHVRCVHMLERHGVELMPSVVAYLALLSRQRAQSEWAHFHLTQALAKLLRVGVDEARLPLALHAAVAAECFPGNDYVQNMPQALLGASIAPWLPREGIRHALTAVRMGNSLALNDVVDAVERLGLLPPSREKFDLAVARQIDHAIGSPVGFSDAGVHSSQCAAVQSFPVALPKTVTHPAPDGDSHYYQFRQAGIPLPVDPVQVHKVANARLVCDHTQAGRSEMQVFADGMCLYDLSLGSASSGDEPGHSIEVAKPLMVVDDYFSGVANVSHFLFDQVPRLLAYRRLHPGPATLLQCDDSTFYRGALEALGVDDTLRPPERRFTVHAPLMFLSSNAGLKFDHPINGGSPRTARLLREAFGVSSQPAKGRRIYVSRADAASRRVLNAPEVEAVLQRFGFEVVTLSGLSFAHKRALFSEASHVAGVHGAGLSNVLFSAADCRLFEIMPPLVASCTYWMLCSAIGQRYRAFVADDPELPTPDYAEWTHDASFNNRDVVVDPRRLATALAEFV